MYKNQQNALDAPESSHNLTDMQLAIIAHLHYMKKVSDGVYLALAPYVAAVLDSSFQNNGQQVHEINIMAGLAAGGVWHCAGRVFVNQDAAVVHTKNVKTVFFRRSLPDDVRTFDYCDPEFPDNLTSFLDLTVTNYLRVSRLAHHRTWERWRRKHKE